MKLLHLIWQGEIGGAEHAVYQLAQQQSRIAGVHVSVAFGQATGLYAQKLVEAGVNVVDLGLHTPSQWQAIPQLRRMFTGYDIHHFHCAEPLLILTSLFVPSVKRVYTYRAGYHTRQGKRAFRFWLTRWLLKTGFHAISANTMHGAQVAERLFHLPKGKAEVTYNGINFDLLVPQKSRLEARQKMGIQDEDEFVVGTISNLKDWKRIDWLFHAATLLPFPNWQIVVIGDGPMRNDLMNLTKELNITTRVKFVGQQSQVADWLIGLDAFVLPSSSGESFGNAAVEALATGLPTVICSDGGGLLEHIKHQQTGWVAEGIKGIAESLASIRANPVSTYEVSEAGKSYVRQKYTVENMVSAYTQLYHSAGLSF